MLPLPSPAQTEYTADGIPTPRTEEFRWHLNRGRSNPAAENALRRTNYGDVSTARGPLAPHASLLTASRNHAEDMAVKNVFQHPTVTNSAFYNWQAHHANSLSDFFDRAIDDGYRPNSGAENITANTGHISAIGPYLSWWNSNDHRPYMYGDYREMGEGHFFNASSTYLHYDALTVARRNAFTGFFTDSMFRDANSSGTYNEGEGIAGIRIELTNNGAAYSSFDISSAAGSFAIPLDGIAAGVSVQVFLTNPTGGSVTLSIPSDFSTLRTLTLPAGQRWLLGTFTRATNTSAGFRNLAFNNAQPVAAPPVTLSISSGRAVINWPSQTGLTYQVQWSENLAAPWVDLHTPALNGTGAVMSVTDPSTTTATPRRFYKVIVTGP